ncbi:Interleukin-12 receptor subunit beta-1, partial [Lemmus lemmus]
PLTLPPSLPGSLSGPRNLSCYRVSGAEYECSWQYDGAEHNVTHFLRCCFGGGRCCYFPAGRSKTVQFSEQAGVPVLSNVTFWVESRLNNWTMKSLEISLCLSHWIKFNHPLGNVKVSRSDGQLLLDWNVSDEVPAEVQFRRRTPTTNWTLGDCGSQNDSGLGMIEDVQSSKSCHCPSEKAAQELQIRRRRWQPSLGAPGGPWSNWSDSVCVPPEPLPQPEVKFLVEPLGQGGRRRLTMQKQSPQPAVPEGCLTAKSGAHVTYLVDVNMLSCACQHQPSKTVSLGKTLSLSGAAYELIVVTKTRFGRNSNQKWHIPAQDLAEMRTLNVSVEGNITSMHWVAQAPDTTYCVERQAWGQDGNHTHCTLIAPPEDGNPARVVTHSWSSEPALGQGECHRLTVFGSKNPENPVLWSTILSSYYFGCWQNHVCGRSWVCGRSQSCGQNQVCGSPNPRCITPAEWFVPPTKTELTLQGLRSGVVYKIQVRADTAGLRGAWSRPQHFSFDTGPAHTSSRCPAPSLRHGSAHSPGSVPPLRLGSGSALRTSRRCCARERHWWWRWPGTRRTGWGRRSLPLSPPCTPRGHWRTGDRCPDA